MQARASGRGRSLQSPLPWPVPMQPPVSWAWPKTAQSLAQSPSPLQCRLFPRPHQIRGLVGTEEYRSDLLHARAQPDETRAVSFLEPVPAPRLPLPEAPDHLEVDRQNLLRRKGWLEGPLDRYRVTEAAVDEPVGPPARLPGDPGKEPRDGGTPQGRPSRGHGAVATRAREYLPAGREIQRQHSEDSKSEVEPSKVQMAEAIQLFSKGCQRRRTFAQEERLPAEEKAHGKKPRGAQHREQANNLVGL